MQVLRASELFNNIENIDNLEFENSKNIELDFSNIENIDLTLLNLQKIALLNNKSLTMRNVKPEVSKLLEVTGLNKTFANVATNPITRRV